VIAHDCVLQQIANRVDIVPVGPTEHSAVRNKGSFSCTIASGAKTVNGGTWLAVSAKRP
jgi:hypothetical protein